MPVLSCLKARVALFFKFSVNTPHPAPKSWKLKGNWPFLKAVTTSRVPVLHLSSFLHVLIVFLETLILKFFILTSVDVARVESLCFCVSQHFLHCVPWEGPRWSCFVSEAELGVGELLLMVIFTWIPGVSEFLLMRLPHPSSLQSWHADTSIWDLSPLVPRTHFQFSARVSCVCLHPQMRWALNTSERWAPTLHPHYEV